jgi:hypothetical protein
MFFNLSEVKYVKDSEALLHFIEETISFLKEKGGDAKLVDNAFFSQITFENNKYCFKLDVSIPLRNFKS